MNLPHLFLVVSAPTLEQIPNEVIYEDIMSRLSPLSTINLGMACKAYLPLAQLSLLTNFGNITANGAFLDIELLDEARDLATDELEKRAIQRLIEADYPVLNTKSLDTQYRYQLAQSILFTDKWVDFNLVLSKSFPAVTRLLLRHKKNGGDHLYVPMNMISPETADAFISWIKKECKYALDWIELEHILIDVDPSAAAKFFEVLGGKSPMVARILAGGGDLTGPVDDEALILAICLTNDKNMNQALEIINTSNTEYMYKYLMNWTRYPHLKPVIMLLYEKTPLDNELKSKLPVCFADLDGPMEYYESLYGAPLVSHVREFLETFDEAKGEFRAPITFALLRAFEVALFSGCSDSLLESIMSLPKFQHDFASVLIAIKLKKPIDFVLKLVQTEPTGEYDLYFEPQIKVDFYLEVFRYIAKHNIEHQPSIFYLLLLLKDDQPALEYVRVFLYELDLNTRTSKELLTIKTYDRFVDADLIRQEVYRFALERGVEFVWENQYGPTRFANKLARQEFMEFFDLLKLPVVLQYIPRDVVRGKRGTVFGGILNSSFYYAFCSFARRPGGGFDLLRSHIVDQSIFEELKFYADLPLCHLPILDQIIRANRADLQMALTSSFDEGCAENMESIVERLKAMQGEPEFKEYVTLLAEECDIPDLFAK